MACGGALIVIARSTSYLPSSTNNPTPRTTATATRTSSSVHFSRVNRIERGFFCGSDMAVFLERVLQGTEQFAGAAERRASKLLNRLCLVYAHVERGGARSTGSES